jgi:hypothetical protein
MDISGESVPFFNMKTGQVALVPRGETLAHKAFEQNPAYRKILGVPPEKKLEWVREFISILFSPEDEALRLKLTAVLDEGHNPLEAYARYALIIKNDENSWDAGWSQRLDDHLWEEMGDFLHAIDPMIKDVWRFDDDCAVCDAMHSVKEKGRVLSENELRAAFAVGNAFNDAKDGKNKTA